MTGPIERTDVVLCNGSDGVCKGDHHGWGCPLSDPAGDVLRTLTAPGAVSDNPILDRWRQGQVAGWLTVGQPQAEDDTEDGR